MSAVRVAIPPPFPISRPRRIRSSPALREALRETRLDPSRLVAPIFVCADARLQRELEALPGQRIVDVEGAVTIARDLEALGVGGVLLFGVASAKDPMGSEAWDDEAAVPRALRALRAATPGLALWADVCLCAFTDHGHCGVIDDSSGAPRVDNDRTLPLLARAAVVYARAGADVVAPSDMMDGRVGAIRAALDEAGQSGTAICSYAAKFTSAWYGPFRSAVDSAPRRGDRRDYQLDPANGREALREIAFDVAEGADLVMVKPALAYLDVLHRAAEVAGVPIAAFNVSGEYAMVKAAAARGWIDERAAMIELLTGIARAGADVIVTYFARDAAEALR